MSRALQVVCIVVGVLVAIWVAFSIWSSSVAARIGTKIADRWQEAKIRASLKKEWSDKPDTNPRLVNENEL